MKVRFKKLHPLACAPVYASDGAMAFDLTAAMSYEIGPGDTMFVDTGIVVEPPAGYAVVINCRSSAAKVGLTLANNQGWIDPDYRGPILVALRNVGFTSYTVAQGDRVAQAMLVPVIRATFEKVQELGETARGDGGFGSTGV